MTKQGFGKLVSLKEATALINSMATEKGNEQVPLEEATGRTIGEDIIAQINVPHFRKSAMDGFAVRAEDTYGASNTNPKELIIIEHITAGATPAKTLTPGTCTEITTGACLPENADAVVMVEYTEKDGETITYYKACAPGNNIISIGSDVKKGQTIIKKGTLFNARLAGVLAALGQSHVTVKEQPTIAMLSTGDELLTAQEELAKGKIYDINSYTLKEALREQHVNILDLGLVKDSKKNITEKILEGTKADIIILSGGSSLGTEDMTKEIIEELGELYVHGIAVKPGKPVIIGKIKGKPIIGLPGYPTSALSNFYILIVPIINHMLGKQTIPQYVTAKLSRKIASTIGRYEFLAVKVKGDAATPVMKGSSSITTLAEANGFLEIDENTEVLNKGEEVQVRRFEQ